MQTSEDKLFASYGNEIYNLFEVEDNRLYENKDTLFEEECENIKISKIDTPWRYSNWYLFNKKNTRSIY
ncbi:hypothetical protein [Spiroplasma apis]|nr:hypothetical protein [Spiroplasma apis]